MNHKLKYSIVFMIGSLYLSGCAGYDRILFVTKTNIGLDVDNKPPTAEITIARRELAISPTFQNAKSNQNTLPLLASFGLTGNFLNPEITSRFAGGEAAVILAAGLTAPVDSSALCLSKQPDTRHFLKWLWHQITFRDEKDKYIDDTRAFYFATDTSFGLKVGWDGTSGPYPDTLKLGYNRKELAFPPIFVSEGCASIATAAPATSEPPEWKVTVPSFFASLDNSSTVKEWSESGVKTHVQFFATGEAASRFLRRADVNAAMYKKMFPLNGFSIDPVAVAVVVSHTKAFKVTGGTGKVKFTMMNDTTGGATVDASTGLYTAGPNAGTSTVGVAGDAGQIAGATVTVNPALAIAPISQSVTHGSTVKFNATGGVEPRKFSISNNQSGATIDEKTGLYKAGSTAGKTDKVKVTDSSLPPISMEATVNVQ